VDVITGTPNSGKSEWLDALLVNLAKQGGWHFVIFSPENWPLELHHAKIIEKYIGGHSIQAQRSAYPKTSLTRRKRGWPASFTSPSQKRPTMTSILERGESFRQHEGVQQVRDRD
jgi:twinkle protein